MKFEEDNPTIKPTSWKSGSPLIFLYFIFLVQSFTVKFVFRNEINNCAPGKLKCLLILSGDLVERSMALLLLIKSEVI